MTDEQSANLGPTLPEAKKSAFEWWMVSNFAVGAGFAAFVALLIPPYVTEVTGSAADAGIDTKTCGACSDPVCKILRANSADCIGFGSSGQYCANCLQPLCTQQERREDFQTVRTGVQSCKTLGRSQNAGI